VSVLPRPKHIRTRLTLWYMLVLAGFLCLYAAGTAILLYFASYTQLTRHTIEDIETVEGLLYFASDRQLHFRDDYHNHAESKQIQERYLEVLSADGRILLRNDRMGDLTLGGSIFAREGIGGYSERNDRLADGTRVILVSRRHRIEGRPIVIRLAYSLESIWLQIRQLLLAFATTLPLALIGAGFAGQLMASRALAPLADMARRAEAVTPEHLDQRLPVDNPDDELGQLAVVFNRTLDRLESGFEQMRRFAADASHELRTPLTAIRSVGEVRLQRECTREEYRETIGSMLEEVNRLTRLVENLLLLSRQDAGQIQLQHQPVRLLDVARECAGMLDVLAEEKSQQLVIEGDEAAIVNGDRLVLRQAIMNVLHNAIKFSPPDTAVRVAASQGHEGVRLQVSDNGPGIPDEHREKIFDRFYRVDPARSNRNGGNGLGLSIARWAVEANEGRLTLHSRADSGCVFQFDFPVRHGGEPARLSQP
jgi:heavy metal sensor kinase